MARAAATVADFEAGNLPSVCAKTGEPTDGYTKVRYSSAPTWTWILLFFGILPFLIAQYFATVHVEGRLPMSEDAQRRVRMFNRIFIGLVVLGCVVIVIGFAIRSSRGQILDHLVLLGLVVLVAAIFILAVGQPFVLPTGQVVRDRVWFSFVHKRFAQELDRFYGGR